MGATTATEIAEQFAQDALRATPVIILGSGASAAHGVPGMVPLANHLQGAMISGDWNQDEISEWQKFCGRLSAGDDLETALGAVRLTERQTNLVATTTRALLLPADLAVLSSLLADRRALPLVRLFKYLFTSTHATLNVITPNYDRLAEYAADAGEFNHFTGFSQGYLQSRAKSIEARSPGNNVKGSRLVCVWKVHGSLDWFQGESKQIIGLRASNETPVGYTPLMITPGIDKYRLTHGEPFRTILACSDAALESARSYFCVGYGFNDEHVQTKLLERCDKDSVPLVVITKALTPTARKFLDGRRCRRFLALEEGISGTRAYSHTHPGGFEIPGEALWQLDKFLNMAIGSEA